MSYVKTLAETKKYTFHLITFEQKKYALSEKEKSEINLSLNAQGIYWFPLKFHTGSFLLLKKIYDFVNLSILVSKIRFIYNAKMIISLSNVSASFAIIFAKLLKMKILIFNYEPHSLFQAELGVWSNGSLKYKLLNRIETYAGLQANYVLTGTKSMVKYLHSKGAKGTIFRAPSSIDENIYKFDPKARIRVRMRLGVEKNKILLYLGKFGGLYYESEIAKFCRILLEHDSRYFFLIVTPNDHLKINKMFFTAGLKKTEFTVTEAFSEAEVIEYISASDIGLSAIPPSPSQKYRSPVKVAEYLMCGLPYITCKGISEDDIYAKKNNVGVVVNSFTRKDIVASIDNINDIIQNDRMFLRQKCREVGISYRSKSNVDKILTDIFSKFIL
jgi:hypothetical protein|tara:strand:- start:1468 stop:2625 length:1158 start_codon:yes stop_codon:yes gene_type:complete